MYKKIQGLPSCDNDFDSFLNSQAKLPNLTLRWDALIHNSQVRSASNAYQGISPAQPEWLILELFASAACMDTLPARCCMPEYLQKDGILDEAIPEEFLYYTVLKFNSRQKQLNGPLLLFRSKETHLVSLTALV